MEVTTLLIFVGAGLAAFFLLFLALHHFKFFRRLLASRMYMGDKGAPQKPLEHAFAWVLPVLRASETDIIEWCGLDAAVYLRMFLFSIQVRGEREGGEGREPQALAG